MKSCHFYYIQRKTDGATEENLFCRNPILLGILGPTASPSGYFRESPRSCFLVSILCSSWYPFPLWRDFGRWGLESVLGRTGRSMFILVSSGCHSKTPQTGGANSKNVFSQGSWSPRSGCQHVCFLVRPPSWLAAGCLITVLSHGREGEALLQNV